MSKLNRPLVICAAAALCSAGPLFAAEEPGTSAAEPGGSRTAAADESRSMSKDLTDQTFVTKAAQAKMAEVELSKLALEKSQNPEVREFAQRMVTDHTKASQELKPIAQKNDLQVPTQLDAKHQKAKDKLQGQSGEAFDQAYVQQMKKGHDEAVRLFESAGKASGLNPELQSFASRTLPTLHEHHPLVADLRPGATRAAQSETQESTPERR